MASERDAELEEMRRCLGAPETGQFSFGIEEEYFLVDAASRQAVFQTPESLFVEAQAASDGRIVREFLQSQGEAATKPCASLARARAEIVFMRTVLKRIAARHGLAFLACGTHPTAAWPRSVQSGKPRYDVVMDTLQMIGRRIMVCGMHVHIQLPDIDRRVDVMTRMIPYLPLFLVLSTSSPFWQGRLTGLRSYRFAAYDELPRSGLPDLFATTQAFDTYVAAMVKAGAIRDASFVWWAIRPSAHYPTLEMRVPDCCTRVEDALAIAALYRVLARHLFYHPECNADVNAVSRAIAQENKWRAQRHGLRGSFVSMDGPVPVSEVLEQAIALTVEDAEELGCTGEVARCRAIIAEGTSADAQVDIFEARSPTDGEEAALAEVVRWIADNTIRFNL